MGGENQKQSNRSQGFLFFPLPLSVVALENSRHIYNPSDAILKPSLDSVFPRFRPFSCVFLRVHIGPYSDKRF